MEGDKEGGVGERKGERRVKEENKQEEEGWRKTRRVEQEK